MSWKASGYVKGLRQCADGAPLSKTQKLILFVLADYHNNQLNIAWVSQTHLAEDAFVSLSQLKRDLAYLEAHAVIWRVSRRGRGNSCNYGFWEFGGPDNSQAAASDPPRQAANTPREVNIKTSPETAHLPQRNSSQIAHSSMRNKERTGELDRTGELARREAPSKLSVPSRAEQWAQRNSYAFRAFCREVAQTRQSVTGVQGVDCRAVVLTAARRSGVPDHIALELEGLEPEKH